MASTARDLRTADVQIEQPKGERANGTGGLIASTFAEDSALAAAARVAGRRNALLISDDELNDLLREHQQLVDKKYAGSVTRKELNRLEYVRWTLDRIEDARHGQTLDALEASVSRYENLIAEIRAVTEQLSRSR